MENSSSDTDASTTDDSCISRNVLPLSASRHTTRQQPADIRQRLLQGHQGLIQVPQGLLQAPQGLVQAPQRLVQAPQGLVQVPQGLIQVPQGQVQAPQGLVGTGQKRGSQQSESKVSYTAAKSDAKNNKEAKADPRVRNSMVYTEASKLPERVPTRRADCDVRLMSAGTNTPPTPTTAAGYMCRSIQDWGPKHKVCAR